MSRDLRTRNLRPTHRPTLPHLKRGRGDPDCIRVCGCIWLTFRTYVRRADLRLSTSTRRPREPHRHG